MHATSIDKIPVLLERQQRRFLRQRIIPSTLLVQHGVVPALKDYLQLLGADLESKGLQSGTAFIHRLKPLVAVRDVELLLRCIFPELEAVFRRHLYDAEHGSLSSFKEARSAILGFILDDTPDTMLHVLEEVDIFILTHLEFIEWTYWDTKADPDPYLRARQKRSFRYLGNRHEILHGISLIDRNVALSDGMVVNALTIYATALKIIKFFVARNIHLQVNSQNKNDIRNRRKLASALFWRLGQMSRIGKDVK